MKQIAPGDEIDYSIMGDFTNSKADYSIVIIGEKPYAEGMGDRTDLSLQKSDIDLIKKMKSYGNPVVVILISGRPMIIEPILHYADAIIAAWLPGTEGEGISDVIFGDYAPSGLLSRTWPINMNQVSMNVGDLVYNPLYPYGFGITSFENSSLGSSPILMSAIVTGDAKNIELTFNKKMKDPSGSTMNFQISRNYLPVAAATSASLKYGDSTTIVIRADSIFTSSDIGAISYSSGNLESFDGGVLQPFSNFDLYNWAGSQSAYNVPGKIEAEDYSNMYGVQTETTSDNGGGLDIGWIDNGDWMEYQLTVSSAGQYNMSLRTAALSQAGNILLTIGSTNLGAIDIPVTGGWQTWTTVNQTVSLNAGPQTLRISAQTGGFNLNWFSFDKITGVKESTPIDFSNRLGQNYPNPFNPTTVISFSLNASQNVSLKVYDVLGREVKTLLNGFTAAGTYNINFDGSGLPSGIYFYKIQTEKFAKTMKMILMK
jgi:beta-glucosidase